jgi:hypothetical protein
MPTVYVTPIVRAVSRLLASILRQRRNRITVGSCLKQCTAHLFLRRALYALLLQVHIRFLFLRNKFLSRVSIQLLLLLMRFLAIHPKVFKR